MFGPNVDFNAVQREIHAVEAIKDHENIVKLFDVEEEVPLPLPPHMCECALCTYICTVHISL